MKDMAAKSVTPGWVIHYMKSPAASITGYVEDFDLKASVKNYGIVP